MQELNASQGELLALLRSVDVDMRASMALNRVTLQALARLSPALSDAIDAGLGEQESLLIVDGPPASEKAAQIVREAREWLGLGPEARMAREMERRLLAAADQADVDDQLPLILKKCG